MIHLAHRALRIKRIRAYITSLTRRVKRPTGLSITLTRRRLLVVFGMGLLLTAIEMIDHYNPGDSSLFRPEFWHRIPIYALILPLLTWILLEWVERTQKIHDQTVRQINRLDTLSVALMEATSWNNLLDTIIQYPRLVLPAVGTALYAFNEEGAQFELGARWSEVGRNNQVYPPVLSLDSCAACLSTQRPAIPEIRSCPVSINEAEDVGTARICGPLIYKGKLTALLHVDLPADHKLSSYEAETLSRAIPEMALAMSSARLERFLADQIEANSEVATTERQRIAQDLHDTLAQNISYLRLKLDQFSGDGTLHDILEIQQDIERMRDAATEAYENIRGTLTALGPNSQKELAEVVRERAIYVGKRAGFAVALEYRPARFPLEPEIRRQLLFICQEALNNVEKHADAQVVTIQIDWRQKELALSIVDDGKGFDADQGPIDGHFGLAVMNQRAASIGGKLTIHSQVGSGTRVELHVPVTAYIDRQTDAGQTRKRRDS